MLLGGLFTCWFPRAVSKSATFTNSVSRKVGLPGLSTSGMATTGTCVHTGRSDGSQVSSHLKRILVLWQCGHRKLPASILTQRPSSLQGQKRVPGACRMRGYSLAGRREGHAKCRTEADSPCSGWPWPGPIPLRDPGPAPKPSGAAEEQPAQVFRDAILWTQPASPRLAELRGDPEGSCDPMPRVSLPHLWL